VVEVVGESMTADQSKLHSWLTVVAKHDGLACTECTCCCVSITHTTWVWSIQSSVYKSSSQFAAFIFLTFIFVFCFIMIYVYVCVISWYASHVVVDCYHYHLCSCCLYGEYKIYIIVIITANIHYGSIRLCSFSDSTLVLGGLITMHCWRVT